MKADSTIRKMLRPASGPSPAAAAGIGRIWGNAVARVAEDRLGLPIECGTAAITGATVSAFLSAIPAHAMLLRLDGPAGSQGLAMFGADAVAALVEMHTMRRLRATAPAPRPPTRTDAAIVSPVFDAALAELTATADEGLVPKWASGWKIAAFAPDPRPLGLTMPDIPYRQMSLPMIFGLERARTSDLVLLVPDGTGVGGAQPLAPDEPDDWQEKLGRAAMPAVTEVKGVLWRIRLPLGGVFALKVGDNVPIPEEAIDSVRVESPDGRCLAVGRLGQLRGDRAVRLRELAGPDGELGPTPPSDGEGPALSLVPGSHEGGAGLGLGSLGSLGGSGRADLPPGGLLSPGLAGPLPGGITDATPNPGSLPDIGPGGLQDLGQTDEGTPAFAFAPMDDLPDRID